MTITAIERASDSPYVAAVMHGYTTNAGSTIRPAEIHWHMVIVRVDGQAHVLVVGPLKASGVVSWGAGAEILWIKFRLGTFMPHLPIKHYLDAETPLPEATGRSFWLNGSTWQLPDFENADTFVDRLVRDHALDWDPAIPATLGGHLQQTPSRTVRHRFLRATGLTQSHIHQVERAQHAAALLRQGVPILDTVYQAGYFDQPHLTRSLKQFIGFTPAQISHMPSPG